MTTGKIDINNHPRLGQAIGYLVKNILQQEKPAPKPTDKVAN